jgi:cysteine-rich repeat protein
VERPCDAAGRRCDGSVLTVCEPRADGCLVERAVDCADTAEVCDGSSGTVRCRAPRCEAIPEAERCTIEGETSCTTDTSLRTCARDPDTGCLRWQQDECEAGLLCEAAEGGTAGCRGAPCRPLGTLACDGVRRIVSTSRGAREVQDWCEPEPFEYDGRELVYRVEGAPDRSVTVRAEVVATTTAIGNGDIDAFFVAPDPAQPDDVCAAATRCLSASTSPGPLERVTTVLAPGESAYLAAELAWNDGTLGAAPDIEISIQITCSTCGDGTVEPGEGCDDGEALGGDGCDEACAVEPGWVCAGAPSVCTPTVCGDGVREGLEVCDDGDLDAGDGCDAGCAIEPGWGCDGAPSRCSLLAPDAVCAGAVPFSLDGAARVDLAVAAGPAPSGAGCAVTSEPGGVRWLSVTVPARTEAVLSLDPESGDDVVGYVLDTCGAACVGRVDSELPGGTERLPVGNPGSAPRTFLVAVGARGELDRGAVSVTAEVTSVVCGDGRLASGEGCDDGDLDAGDGCGASCAVEPGFACFGQPSRCSPVAPNGLCAGAVALSPGAAVTGDLTGGGPLALASCGPYAERNLFYTAPAGMRVQARPLDGQDLVVASFGACTDLRCATAVNAAGAGATERLYTTGSTSLVVHARSTTTGRFELLAEATRCGDGVIDPGEVCDDGGAVGGDGCRPDCRIEDGWRCAGEPSRCITNCGDGVVEVEEECDPGAATTPGCRACVIQAGYFCTGAPSTCEAVVCGDGAVGDGEGCDDGGTVGGDGCSARCAIELPAAGASVTAMGSAPDTGPFLARPGGMCEDRASMGMYGFEALTLENTGPTARTFRFHVAWESVDGFLAVSRYPLDPGAPSLRCLAANDDFMGIGQSQVEGVEVAPGQRVVAVLTTYLETTAIPGFVLEVTGE